MMNLSGSMLQSMTGAEKSLRRREISAMISNSDSPLKEEIEKKKGMYGDLADLPAGHPLLREMEAAQKRQSDRKKATEEKTTVAATKKARAVDLDRIRREKRDSEEQESGEIRVAALSIDKLSKKVLGSLIELTKELSEKKPIFDSNRLCSARVVKLMRLVTMLSRGISECRLSGKGEINE